MDGYDALNGGDIDRDINSDDIGDTGGGGDNNDGDAINSGIVE